jgi:formamidopyrimidine-DNA glycosylase
MPELPDVETVRRGLIPVLAGRRLKRVIVRRGDLRRPVPKDFAKRLEGRRVESIGRRSKFLLVRLDGGEVLIIHLGMSGRLRVHEGKAPPLEAHDHVIFATDGAQEVRFHDPRRFGLMALAREERLDRHPFFAKLGPEPLDPAFDGKALAARLKGRKTSIKAALMDQRVVAGLGNIYVCESLFRAGLSPKRTAATVQGERAERLAQAIRAVLGEAIAAGGSSLRDHRQPSGELGYFQHRFAVYDREGERCTGCACDRAKTGGIRRINQGGRSSFYCPAKQR